MTESAVYLQPAFILQSQNYRETSLLLDVLTLDYGRISVLANGVRKQRSKTAGLLKPFTPLIISYQGKSELKKLQTVESAGQNIPLVGISVYCAFYINELICCFLQKSDPYQEIFKKYQDCLVKLLDNINLESTLRIFELDLLDAIGYGLQLDFEADKVKPNSQNNALMRYGYSIDSGLVMDNKGEISEKTRQAMIERSFTDPQVLAESKKLMRTVIDLHLQGKQLKSRTVINKIIKAKHG
jgi:DNA repair protein RecO (recombination protein O)